MDDRRFIEIQRQGKILQPMRLCSGKMWKSNVKNFFFHIISHVGLSELVMSIKSFEQTQQVGQVTR